MMIFSALLWLYRLSLRIFPQRFRADFEAEMVAVFAQCLAHQSQWGMLKIAWRELVQLPDALIQAYRVAWQGTLVGRMLQSPFHPLPPAPDGRFSWWQTFLETSLFIVSSTFLILIVYQQPAWIPVGWQHPSPGMGWLVLLMALPVLLWGLVYGLPRWAYPPGGFLLGYSFLIAQQYRLTSFWIMTVFASFLLTLVAIYTHNYRQPLSPVLQRLGASMSLDWTRLSFGLYGMMPTLLVLAYDDIYPNHQTLYLAFSLLIMWLGALLYSRSHHQKQQLAVLMSGVSLALGIVFLEQLYFQGAWRNTPKLWLADLRWLSTLWSFMMTLLLLPMLATWACRAWAVADLTPLGGE